MTATLEAPSALVPLLTPIQVMRRLHVSRSTFYRMLDRGEFPRPLRRNRKWVRWPESDVTNYLDQLNQARSA